MKYHLKQWFPTPGVWTRTRPQSICHRPKNNMIRQKNVNNNSTTSKFLGYYKLYVWSNNLDTVCLCLSSPQQQDAALELK